MAGMEGLQILGIIAFIYGILWASSTLQDARQALAAEHLAPLRRIERFSVANNFGPVLPLIAGLGVVSIRQQHAVGIAVAATLLTVMLLFLRGIMHAQRMRGAGVPETYLASYRKAHAIRAGGLAICASTLLYPVLAQALA